MGACLGRCRPRRGPRPKECASSSGKPTAEPEPPQEEKVKEVLSISEKPKLQTPQPSKKEDLAGIEEEGCVFVPNKARNDSSFVSTEVCSEGFSVTKSVNSEERLTSKPTANLQPKIYTSARETVQNRRTINTPPVTAGCHSGMLSPSMSRRKHGCGGGRMHSMGKASAEGNGESLASKGARRNAGERSDSRSMSPARNRAAALHWRSLSASSAGWRSVPQSLAVGRAEEGRDAGDGTRASQGRDMAERRGCIPSDAGASADGKESLENPFVSLECFIFL